MLWTLDERFKTVEDEAIVAFIDREHPFHHDDGASGLIESAKGQPNVQWYCPDIHRYACVVLHTNSNRIFGIAFGMRGLAYPLPSRMIREAVADGGRLYSEIEDQWVLFQPWQHDQPGGVTQARLNRWRKMAHDYAVGSGALGRRRLDV